MAITQNLLASAGDETDLSVYTTASQTPGANRLVLAIVSTVNSNDSIAPVPTMVGNGITWVQIGTVTYKANDRQRITCFRAMGSSPSSGTVVITMSEDQLRATWIFSEFIGVEASGSNGANAVVQTTTNVLTSTSITVTLAAFSSVNNATYGCFAQGATGAITEGSGFSQIAEHSASFSSGAHAEWKNSNDTTVDMSSGENTPKAGIAVEIKAETFASGAHGKMGFMF